MREKVIIKGCASYAQPEVDAAVEAICAEGGLDALVQGAKRVVLKLNLLMKAGPDEAVTTHPAVVRGMIAALQRRGVQDIVLADSPSGFFSEQRLRAVYERCGIAALAGPGVRLNYNTDAHLRSGAGKMREFEIVDVFSDPDAVVIGVGKVKTHAMTGMSGAVKNFFGTIPGLTKAEMHCRVPDKPQFCEMLCELFDLVHPSFQLMDGIVGMEGNGPSGGRPRNFGFLIGGQNGYAVDRVLCEVIGMGPRTAMTVNASIRRGSAPEALEQIEILGDRDFAERPVRDLLLPQSAETDFSTALPGFLRPLGKRLFRAVSPRPVIREKDCVGCAMCYEICPQRTIQIQNKKAKILPENCIKCFCCHEVCPQRAIDIRTNLLFRLLK